MLGVQSNPFHKPNPFKPLQYDRFQHPHLKPSTPLESSLYYKEQPRPSHSRVIENNWTFNENNLGKRYDFSKKQDLTSSRVSDFEMKMKMSNIGIPNKNAPRVAYVSEARLENPFFRKNLLINKEEVKNQVELEVSLYRPKAKTTYESVPAPSIDDSPVLSKPRASFSEYNRPSPANPSDSPNSLGYSKTPQLTQRMPSDRVIREESREMDDPEHPHTINFKGRTFFLN